MAESKKGTFMTWIDDRFPFTETMEYHLTKYYAPKNFNLWYYFGVFSMVMLVMQIVTGIFLTMNYKPDGAKAFASVEYIMRDVNFGDILRYMHSTGASFFFIAVYLHMFRALLYGSYQKPRELIWVFGMVIYLCLMAEAFMGYLLPWGQMSYWGAQVIINLFNTIPFFGPAITEWVRGDFIVSDITLNRFFAFHVIALPLVLVALVFLHIVALHHVGSNNPDGVDIKQNKDDRGVPRDGVAFHPYYTVKDTFGLSVFLTFFFIVVFFMPEMGGYFLEHANFIPADPLKTPEHIAPVWYFTPFYAMLRAVPPIAGSAFPGVLVMFGAIIILFFLPWIDRGKVRSIRYRSSIYKTMLMLFALSFIVLGYYGIQPPSTLGTILSRVCTLYYFAYFVLLWWISGDEKTKPVPERVTS